MRQRRLVQAFGVTVLDLLSHAPPWPWPRPSPSPSIIPRPSITPPSEDRGQGWAQPREQALCRGSLCGGVELGRSRDQPSKSRWYRPKHRATTTSVKAAMIAADQCLREGGGTGGSRAALGAPANVQAAMKGLFTYVGSYRDGHRTMRPSITQLATSMESLVQTSQVEADSPTVANYVTAQCGRPRPPPRPRRLFPEPAALSRSESVGSRRIRLPTPASSLHRRPRGR